MVNKVLVIRKTESSVVTLSQFSFDDIVMGDGLEDVKREVKIAGQTCIPCGIFIMGLRTSPALSRFFMRDENGYIMQTEKIKTDEDKARFKYPHELIWVKNVPDFQYIYWHWGNKVTDTDGCYLVGSYFGELNGMQAILESIKKYIEIYPILWQAIKHHEKEGTQLLVEYKEE